MKKTIKMKHIAKKAAIAAVCAVLVLFPFAPRLARADGMNELEARAQSLYDEIMFLEEVTYDNHTDMKQKIDALIADCKNWLNDKNTMENINPPIKETDLSFYIKNHIMLVDMKEKQEYYAKAAASGLLAEIDMNQEAKAGDNVIIKIKLLNTKSTGLNDISYEIAYSGRLLAAKTATRGTFNLAANESKAVESEFTAKEGGYCVISVKFTNTGGTLLCEPKSSIFINSPGYFFADCHTHSTKSDGADSLMYNMRAALKDGTNILYATDHNAFVEKKDDLDASGENLRISGYKNFMHLKGNEITDYNGGAGHSLYYNPTKHYDAPYNSQGYAYVIGEIIKNGGMFYLAHPFDIGSNSFKPLRDTDYFNIDTSIDEFLAYFTGFTGLEIISYFQYDAKQHTSNYNARTIPSLKLWDMANLKGEMKYFGLGNSDAHASSVVDLNKNSLYLEEFTENRVNNALATGKLYATNGPELRFSLDGKIMGDSIVTETQKQAVLKISAYATTSPLIKVSLIKYEKKAGGYREGYETRSETVLFDDPTAAQNKESFTHEADIAVKPGEFYRVEVKAKTTSSFVRQAYSNPIWVTNPASNLSLDKQSVNLKPGETTKLNIVTDNVYDTVKFTSSDNKAVEVLDNGFIKVNANASGTYTVTAANETGITASCSVVTPIAGNDGGGRKGCKKDASAIVAAAVALLIFAAVFIRKK